MHVFYERNVCQNHNLLIFILILKTGRFILFEFDTVTARLRFSTESCFIITIKKNTIL